MGLVRRLGLGRWWAKREEEDETVTNTIVKGSCQGWEEVGLLSEESVERGLGYRRMGLHSMSG